MSDYGDLYFDKQPARYAYYCWQRCVAWWESQRSKIQEDYDMAMGLDAYMEAKAKKGFSGLTVPLIYVIAEARIAAFRDILERQEPFFRVRPTEEDNSMSRIAAERKESVLQTLRRVLGWDANAIELFQGCEFSNHAWLAIEPVTKRIGANFGLLVRSERIGTERDYITWTVHSPGQILIDGFYRDDAIAPTKVKLAWMPWHQLRQQYPEYTKDVELRKQAKPRDDSLFYNPNDARQRGSSDSMALRWTGGGGSADELNRGFLVAEAHLNAVYSDNTIRKVIYTFLPDVTNTTAPGGESSAYGYRLCPAEGSPFPYESVDDLLLMARIRKLPYSMTGRSTAELLFSMQREFSDAIASERDLDRRALQPDLIMRSNMLIGTEDPQQGIGTTWEVNGNEDSDRTVSLDNILRVVNYATPNRGYLVNTREKMQSLMELVGAAMEATTGGEAGNKELLGVFRGRTRGAQLRLNLVFASHAEAMIRAADSIMAVMGELDQEMLYPSFRAESKTFGRPTPFMREDIIQPTETYIPALSEYSAREEGQMMWMTLGEVLLPMFGGNPEPTIMLVEDIIRHFNVNESRTEQYIAAMRNGLLMAQAADQTATMPPQINSPRSPKLAQMSAANQIGAVP